MGEVYLARDTELDRDVALKVLPPDLAANKEKGPRFKREAKAVAALNHPHIVTVYSVEEAEGVHFITMELVRGKTLSEIIPRKGLSLAKFLEIAIPLADAVAAAHEKGILHRDLKPDNLMMTDEGRLKILDFGLAKLKPEAGVSGVSELPTKSRTEEGRIVGTVAYMSPEQAEGKTLDSRSDIFSLGIVLYEMATGERPFQGETTASVLSSILKDAPRSVTELNPDVPRDMSRLINRCLVKDPEHRYQTAKDVRNELEVVRQEVESGDIALPTGVARSTRRILWPAIVTVALLFGVAWLMKPRTDKMEPVFSQLTSERGEELHPSLSSDGEWIVYASEASGNWDIYQRRVGGQTFFNLTKDSLAADTHPAFSPDGKRIAFRSERDGGGVFVMGATGESVRRLTDFGYFPTWSPDGLSLACSTDPFEDPQGLSQVGSELWVVAVATGEKRLVSAEAARQPQWSPNGHRIAYWSAPGGVRDIWTILEDGGSAVRVTDDPFTDWNPAWSPDGRYLYFSSDRGGTFNIWRVRIDEASGKTLGQAEPVTAGVGTDAQWLSIARDGRHLAYVSNVEKKRLEKVAFDPVRSVAVDQPVSLFEGSIKVDHPDPSPDGEWLAVQVWDKRGNIGVARTDGTSLRKLTDDGSRDCLPHWSPDGKRISFWSNRGGTNQIWSIQPDGSGLQQLTDASQDVINQSWSPDGTQIIASVGGKWMLFDRRRPWQGQTPRELPSVNDPMEFYGPWSPDGQRVLLRTVHGEIALLVLETQQYHVLTDAGRLDGLYDGFCERPWLQDGRSLLFVEAGEIWRLNSESKEQSQVFAPAAGKVSECVLSPDNRVLYFTVAAPAEADIWMLTMDETL